MHGRLRSKASQDEAKDLLPRFRGFLIMRLAFPNATPLEQQRMITSAAHQASISSCLVDQSSDSPKHLAAALSLRDQGIWRQHEFDDR